MDSLIFYEFDIGYTVLKPKEGEYEFYPYKYKYIQDTYYISDDSIGFNISFEDLDRVNTEILREIERLWSKYVLSPEHELTREQKTIKQNLLSLFHDTDD